MTPTQKKICDTMTPDMLGEELLAQIAEPFPDEELIRYLIVDRAADLTVRDGDKYDALALAAYYGMAAVTRMLVAADIKLENRDASGRTPLMRAANGEIVKILVAAGANIHAEDHTGNKAPFLYAGAPEKLSAMQSFIAHVPAVIDHQSKHKKTALMQAAVSCNLPCLEFLMESGADPLLVNTQGQTARQLMESKAAEYIARYGDKRYAAAREKLEKLENYTVGQAVSAGTAKPVTPPAARLSLLNKSRGLRR